MGEGKGTGAGMEFCAVGAVGAVGVLFCFVYCIVLACLDGRQFPHASTKEETSSCAKRVARLAD